jgi:ABC-type antimicrobial peptide transport system permease subunit
MNEVNQVNTTKLISGYASSADEAQKVSDELQKDKEFNKDLSTSTQKDIIGGLSSLFGIVSLILTAVSALALIVAGVMILLILYSNVIERTKEIGIYRSLGYRKKNIRIMFISEAIVIGLISSAVSIIITLIISAIVNNVTRKSINVDVMKLELMSALAITAITLVICFVAALFPAFKAAKLDPVEALRYE